MKKLVKMMGIMLLITCLVGCSSESKSSKLPDKGSSEFHSAGKQSAANDLSEEADTTTTSDNTASTDATISDSTVSDNTESSDNSAIEATDNQTDNSANANRETAYYLTDEAMGILKTLPTDYSKVHWGVVYSPEGMDGLVISVAPYIEGDLTYLIIGFTNIYNQTIAVTADGYAMDGNGSDIGTVYAYQGALGAGSTILCKVHCDGIPTGEVHWNSVEATQPYGEALTWHSTWGLMTDSDGYYYADYTMDSSSKMRVGDVWLLVLDSNGDIIGYGDDYNATEGTAAEGQIDFYTKDLENFEQLAMFSNPVAVD